MFVNCFMDKFLQMPMNSWELQKFWNILVNCLVYNFLQLMNSWGVFVSYYLTSSFVSFLTDIKVFHKGQNYVNFFLQLGNYSLV